MAGTGILRKSWRLLPQLIQVIMLLAVLHLLSQGFLVRVKRSMRHAFTESESDPSSHLSHPHRPPHHHGPGRFNGRPGGFKGRPAPKKKIPKKNNPHKRPPLKKKMFKRSSTTTTTTTTPAPLPSMEVLQWEMDKRLEHLNMTCSKWRLGVWADGTPSELLEEDASLVSNLPTKARYQALFVSTEKNISFCPVTRAGSNWVSKRLLEMSGWMDGKEIKSLSQPPSVLARHRFPFLTSWDLYPVVLAHSTNMLVVRHPFDRLLGYYRGELENAKRNPNVFLSYGKRIVTKYRKKPEFQKEPTFAEFIHYILDQDEKHMDESWQSVAKKCTPCHVPYTVIGHYESLWRDASFAWFSTGRLMDTQDYPNNELTSEIRRKYFSQLTLGDMIQLHKKYKLDFELFGYTLEEHLSYAATGDDSFDPEQLAALPRADTSYLLKVEQKEVENKVENVLGNVHDKEEDGVVNNVEDTGEENVVEEENEENDDGSGVEDEIDSGDERFVVNEDKQGGEVEE